MVGSFLGILLGLVLITVAFYKRKDYTALPLGGQEFLLLFLIGVIALIINLVGIAIEDIGLDSVFYFIFFMLELITIGMFFRVYYLNRRDIE